MRGSNAHVGGAKMPSEIEKSKISRLTRRKVSNVFQRVRWWGDLDEVAFLSRLYDLAALPSTDGRFEDAVGDIWQHRIANIDWEDHWVFADERLGIDTSDEKLLNFLAETVHPEVRDDAAEVESIVSELNSHLMRDGWM